MTKLNDAISTEENKVSSSLMYGTTGVYQENRGNVLVTVRVLECVEFNASSANKDALSNWMALVTYIHANGEVQVENTRLTNGQKEYCLSESWKGGDNDLFKARVAQAYWEIIK